MSGQVAAVSGMLIEVSGITGELAVGDRIAVHGQSASTEPSGHGCVRSVAAEVVGFRNGMARALAFGPLDGLGPRSAATLPFGPGRVRGAGLPVSDGWLGRVVDPLGQPLDGRGALPAGTSRPVRANPPPGATRARLGPRIGLGVKALDLFATCRAGQRLGLFAGSGVGKSTLMSQMIHQADADVAVLALVGERGREVREFLEDDLGAEGLARAVTVIATSDQPPLMRREAAYAAMTIAEHFRDQGLHVLLLMDSVTRFCLALREIGLAAGEPPATRGYPPSVFAELPRLLERAGPGPDRGPESGRITALFTVLVEGDDHNEPVADAVRGILDGHVILDRRIGEAGRYPAVDVLRSLSRTVPGCLDPMEAALVRRARAILSLHADMADLVRLGAYRAGTDPATDEALRLAPRIEAVLRQMKGERSTLPEAFAALHDAMEPADAA
ncbi:MAG TPA: FliI/YscN family ATPase [Acetobacteraceae bacterium]